MSYIFSSILVVLHTLGANQGIPIEGWQMKEMFRKDQVTSIGYRAMAGDDICKHHDGDDACEQSLTVEDECPSTKHK